MKICDDLQNGQVWSKGLKLCDLSVIVRGRYLFTKSCTQILCAGGRLLWIGDTLHSAHSSFWIHHLIVLLFFQVVGEDIPNEGEGGAPSCVKLFGTSGGVHSCRRITTRHEWFVPCRQRRGLLIMRAACITEIVHVYPGPRYRWRECSSHQNCPCQADELSSRWRLTRRRRCLRDKIR